jgi:hypothetical protein
VGGSGEAEGSARFDACSSLSHNDMPPPLSPERILRPARHVYSAGARPEVANRATSDHPTG